MAVHCRALARHSAVELKTPVLEAVPKVAQPVPLLAPVSVQMLAPVAAGGVGEA